MREERARYTVLEDTLGLPEPDPVYAATLASVERERTASEHAKNKRAALIAAATFLAATLAPGSAVHKTDVTYWADEWCAWLEEA